jgi:hypothetical protein
MGSNTALMPQSRSRALMTDTDRKQIAGEVDEEHKRYQAASRVRDRLGALETDIETLEEHHPRLLAEIRDVVCDDREDDETNNT